MQKIMHRVADFNRFLVLKKVKVGNFQSLIFLAFLFLLPISLFSQNLTFTNYSVEKGLPHPSVLNIVQDSKGYLWVGTKNGLSKFDGINFQSVPLTKSNDFVLSIFYDNYQTLWVSTSTELFKLNTETLMSQEVEELKNYFVHNVFQDKERNLWFATNFGLKKLKNGKVETFSTENGLPENFVSSITQDKKGKLWFATFNGVATFENGKINSFTEEKGLPNKNVNQVFIRKNGEIWVGTNNGVARFNGKKFEVPKRFEKLKNKKVVSILEDEEGNLWFGTRSGLYTDQNKILKKYSINDGLGNDIVNCLFLDSEKNIWVGTEFGIAKFYPKVFEVFTTQDGLKGNNVSGVTQDTKGNFWFSIFRSGLTRFDGNRFISYSTENGLLSNEIVSISKAENGRIWVATKENGISVFQEGVFRNFTTENGLASNEVTKIFVDSESNVWVGTVKDGLSKFSNGKFKNYKKAIDESELKKLVDNHIVDILEDSEGRIWVATQNGISIFENEKFESFRLGEGGLSRYLEINSLAVDFEKDVWIGTDKGLLKYLPNSEETDKYFESVLPKEQQNYFRGITSIEADTSNNLWLATNAGVLRFNPKTHDFKRYGKHEGFTAFSLNKNATFRDNKNDFWFGTTKGVFHFQKKKDKINTLAPYLNLLEIQTSAKEILEPKNGLVLSQTQNSLTINFLGVSLRVPEKVLYRYKLEGLDEGWSEEVREGKAAYPKLPSGVYTFLVKAGNNDGVWTKEPVEFTFEVLTPWWETWYFYIFSTFAFLLLIWEGKRIIVHKLEREHSEELEKITQEKKLEIAALQNKRYREELEQGARIQAAMLPSQDPNFEGLEVHGVSVFATEVGGDYYDFFPLSKTQLGISIGDATGHGIGSGLLVATTKSGMLMSVKNLEIESLMDNLNDVIRETASGKSDSAMALCYSILDIEKRKMITVSGGMPYPYHFVASEKKLEEIRVNGFLLGKSKWASYKAVETSFQKDDYFIFISDGLPEAFNELSQQYGYERLKELIFKYVTVKPSARELCNALIGGVKEFMKTRPQDDDITVVVVKVTK
ncbi:MAG: hypothetical protein DWQ06_04780 [Calditrichaeota bacterium]|nr:MAG: hypothetical protein DWQ06_04780 [Calditrichota bacterium]